MGQIITLHSAVDAWLARGTAAEQDGRLDDAVAAFEQAVAADPRSVRAWHRLAEGRCALLLFEPAEDAYHRVLDLCQDHLPTWLGLARLYGKMGRTRQQCFALSWLLMLDPSNCQARAELALALEAKGEAWQAKRHWLKLLSLRPDGTEADLARSRLRGGPG